MIGSVILVIFAGSGFAGGVWAQSPDPAPATPTAAPANDAIRRLETVARLQPHVDLAVVADVADVTVGWSDDRTRIETTARLRVVETPAGEAPAELTVTTPGGELEGRGMAVSHMPHWEAGERLLLLLNSRTGAYQVAGGEAGQIAVADGQTPELNLSVAEVVEVAVTGAIAEPVRLAAAAAPSGGGPAARYGLLGFRWPAERRPFRYHVNTGYSPATVGHNAFLDHTGAAFWTWTRASGSAVSWSYSGTTGQTLSGSDHTNTVFWGPLSQSGVIALTTCWYDPSSRLAYDCDVQFDPYGYAWSVSDSPVRGTIDFQSTALHEFGHFLGLGHSSDQAAVMYPWVPVGAFKRVPNGDDLAGVAALYPGQAVPTLPPLPTAPSYTPTRTSTPTPTHTPTRTPTPTHTPTPTTTYSPTPFGTPARRVYLPLSGSRSQRGW